MILWPIIQVIGMPWQWLWENVMLPIISASYKTLLDRSKPIFDFFVQKVVWPLMTKLAPHLQQKELLKKLAYPFVTGFSHIQTYVVPSTAHPRLPLAYLASPLVDRYLLPNWFLTNVEIFICHLFGHTYNSTVLTKDKDIALVVVVSFILLLELLVIALGYIVKGFYVVVWWWMNDFVIGRLIAPAFVDEFFSGIYHSLIDSSAFGHSWTVNDVFALWPNLGTVLSTLS